MAAPEQLDIFAHSTGVALRNDVIEALERRDAPAARGALQALAAACPHDADRAAFERLIGVLERVDPGPLTRHDAAAAESRVLDEEITRCAREALGSRAQAWLRPLWMALAERCSGLPFAAEHAEQHAAASWLRAGCWHEAALAVERIESWRRIPAPLAWMAEATYRRNGLDVTWPLLAELAWMAPARLDALQRRLDDPVLQRLRQRFDAGFEGSGSVADLAWLPAWLLIEQPRLATRLGAAERGAFTAPEQGMRVLLQLLAFEHEGRHHELMQRRRTLRDLHPSLFAAYMATR